MAAEDHASGDWKSIAAVLLARREDPQPVWGPADELLIARYLAGDCNASERGQVEAWMQDYPAVRELVDSVQATLETVAAVNPTSLSLKEIWQRTQDAVSLLTETISGWIDAGGKSIYDGLTEYQAIPALAVGRAMDEAAAESGVWQIPLVPTESKLSLRLSPPRDRDSWRLILQTTPALTDARVELSRPGESPELSDRLSAWEQRPIPLEVGKWILQIRRAEHSWQLPLTVGVLPP